MESVSVVRLLSNIISDAVSTLENAYAAAAAPLPSLDKPFDAKDPTEKLRKDPTISEAVMNIVAAAGQLTATVRDPVASVLNSSHAFHISSCLRAASELNVVEILRDAGDKGVPAKEIGLRTKTSPDLVARILRLLATHHIFREVAPGVFANNRISSTLDTGKPASVLFDKPTDRLTGTSGVSAFVEFLGDECLKSGAFLTDTLLRDPAASELPFNRAFATQESIYSWFERPENKYSLARFTMAMHLDSGTATNDLSGFPWHELAPGSVVVDLGAGIGSYALSIAKVNGDISVILQDRGATIQSAK
ncbi:hypothetical protein B0H11DRAFT_1818170, partial [Mycena galericulata]